MKKFILLGTFLFLTSDFAVAQSAAGSSEPLQHDQRYISEQEAQAERYPTAKISVIYDYLHGKDDGSHLQVGQNTAAKGPPWDLFVHGRWASAVLAKAGLIESAEKNGSPNILSMIEKLQNAGWMLRDDPIPGALVVRPDQPTRGPLSGAAFVGKDLNKRIYVMASKDVVEIDISTEKNLSTGESISSWAKKFFDKKGVKYLIPPGE